MITLSRFPGALEGWVEHNLACADYAYGLRMPWVPVGHSHCHYLHDPDNRMLPVLLEHCERKPERVFVGTVRVAAEILS